MTLREQQQQQQQQQQALTARISTLPRAASAKEIRKVSFAATAMVIDTILQKKVPYMLSKWISLGRTSWTRQSLHGFLFKTCVQLHLYFSVFKVHDIELFGIFLFMSWFLQPTWNVIPLNKKKGNFQSKDLTPDVGIPFVCNDFSYNSKDPY